MPHLSTRATDLDFLRRSRFWEGLAMCVVRLSHTVRPFPALRDRHQQRRRRRNSLDGHANSAQTDPGNSVTVSRRGDVFSVEPSDRSVLCPLSLSLWHGVTSDPVAGDRTDPDLLANLKRNRRTEEFLGGG